MGLAKDRAILILLLVMVDHGTTIPEPPLLSTQPDQGDYRQHRQPVNSLPEAWNLEVSAPSKSKDRDDKFFRNYNMNLLRSLNNTAEANTVYKQKPAEDDLQVSDEVPLLWIAKEDIRRVIPWIRNTVNSRSYTNAVHLPERDPEDEVKLSWKRNAREFGVELLKLLKELQEEILRLNLEKDELKEMCRKLILRRKTSGSEGLPQTQKLKRAQHSEHNKEQIRVQINQNLMNRRPWRFTGRMKQQMGHYGVNDYRLMNARHNFYNDIDNRPIADTLMTSDLYSRLTKNRSVNGNLLVEDNLTGSKLYVPESFSNKTFRQKKHQAPNAMDDLTNAFIEIFGQNKSMSNTTPNRHRNHKSKLSNIDKVYESPADQTQSQSNKRNGKSRTLSFRKRFGSLVKPQRYENSKSQESPEDSKETPQTGEPSKILHVNNRKEIASSDEVETRDRQRQKINYGNI